MVIIITTLKSLTKQYVKYVGATVCWELGRMKVVFQIIKVYKICLYFSKFVFIPNASIKTLIKSHLL